MDEQYIEQLERENKQLKKQLAEMLKQRQVDMAQMVFMRRQIDFLMEGTQATNEH